MKKLSKAIFAVTFAAAVLAPVSAKAKKGVKIAIPNDTTNEARALLLLQDNGYLKLKDGAGITATPLDIKENPYGIKFQEVEAAQLPNVLRDVDYAIINANYALGANLNPSKDALLVEGSSSAYVNILTTKQGKENDPAIKALVAALQSQQIKDFMDKTYNGAVISVVKNPTDGYDSSINYDAIKGKTVSVAATPTPHCEVLEIAKEILAKKGVNLKIVEFTDYVQPNNVVESGEIDTNYFQHIPYLDDFNKEKGTHIISVAGIHVEPFGLYPGKQKSLDAIKR